MTEADKLNAILTLGRFRWGPAEENGRKITSWTTVRACYLFGPVGKISYDTHLYMLKLTVINTQYKNGHMSSYVTLEVFRYSGDDKEQTCEIASTVFKGPIDAVKWAGNAFRNATQ